METEPGSAMHIHQSPVRISDGHNVFSGDNGGEEFSPLFGHYGRPAEVRAGGDGLLRPEREFLPPAGVRRSVPSNVHWGFDNRTCGLRVPLDTPENMRVESRFAGSDANPIWPWPPPRPPACWASASRARRPRRSAAAPRSWATTCRARWARRWTARALPGAARNAGRALLPGLCVGQAQGIRDLLPGDQLTGT